MKALLSIIAVVLSCTSVTLSAERLEFPGGIDGPSCTQWLEYRSTSNEQHNTQMDAWAYGVLLGANAFGVKEKGNRKIVPPASKSVGSYVDKYCRANPSRTSTSAVNKLYSDLLEQPDDSSVSSDSK
jgi:hypothetical protein